jgi:hypothetical protein
MFGHHGAGDVNLPPRFDMPNMGGAANNAYGQIGDMSQYTNMGYGAIPYAQQTFQGMYNNPFAGGAMSGAMGGAGMGQNAALGGYGAGANYMNAGVGAIPYAQQIMQTGFDPQQALYGRTAQQTQEQTRAGLESRGMDRTPYGAGVEGQTMANFNIDWQNNQLGRQSAAAGAAGGLLGAGSQVAGRGYDMMNTGAGNYAQFGAMPYGTSMGIYGNQNQALMQELGVAGAGQGLAQGQIGDWLSYLQTGNQAGQVANQNAKLALDQNQMAFGQNQMLGSQLGGALYGLGRGFPGAGGSVMQPGGGFGGSPLWGGIARYAA